MNELQGAYLRRERAREHVEDLERLVAEVAQLCENGVLAGVDLDTGDWIPAPWVVDPFRQRAGVIVGETVYNLRAALDYLVYVLAEADSGATQSGTQFPIEDAEDNFTRSAPRILRGVSAEHAAVLRQFQPYKGCEWTRLLRDLSNPDKHRELVSIDVDFSVHRVVHLFEQDPEAEADPDPIDPSPDMTVYLKGPALVTLPDGRPVVDTLRELETQVGLLLLVFAYEFPSG